MYIYIKIHFHVQVQLLEALHFPPIQRPNIISTGICPQTPAITVSVFCMVPRQLVPYFDP